MKKHLALLLGILLLVAPYAHAFADITNNFNVQNVDALAFDCQDAACNAVAGFSGEFPEGQNTNDGSLLVRYPDSLATPFGYAVYFTAEGFLPIENLDTFNTGGSPNQAVADVDVNFVKKDVCRALVDNLVVINDAQPNVPVVIRTNMSIDGDVASAFALTDNEVGFIPDSLKQEFYAVDTRVTMTIFDANDNIVEQQVQEFTADTNNAIFADTKQPVEFQFIPQQAGTFKAQIRSDVIDNQCAAQEPQTTTKEQFEIVNEVENACFTILNNLALSETFPRVNEPLNASFTKISNLADGSGNLNAVPTDILLELIEPDGDVITLVDQTFDANANTVDAVSFTVPFTPAEAGATQLRLTGVANADTCNALTNLQEVVTVNFNVEDEAFFTAFFQVLDDNGNPAQGATITIDNRVFNTDADGKAEVPNLAPNTFVFSVEKAGFVTVNDQVTITNADVDVIVTLNPFNRAPVITNLPDLTIVKNTDNPDILNLNNFVTDDDHLDSELVWTVAGQNQITAIIEADNFLSLNVGEFVGQETLTLTVTDPTGLSDSDSIIVTVVNENSAPEINGLPDVEINEDEPLNNAFLLDDFAQDAETADENLIFTIVQVTDADVGVSIDADHFVDIQPRPNFNGVVDVTIQVSDGALTDTDTFRITVNSNNDRPIALPFGAFVINVAETLTLDLGLFQVDRDDNSDQLTWTASGVDNNIITVVVDNVNKLLRITGLTAGVDEFTMTLTDSANASDSENVTVTVVDNNNDNNNDNNQADDFRLRMARIRVLNADDFVPGEPLVVRLSFENEGDFALENVKATVVVPDLGIRRSVGRFDLGQGEQADRTVVLDTPFDMQPGVYYPVRITVSNDRERRVVYRDIYVHPDALPL